MKRLHLFSLIIYIILGCSFTSKASDKVSVFIEGSLSELQEQIVNNAFMSRLSSTKTYSVFERSELFIDALNQEHDYQVSGEVPESQIRKIANKYGVDFVIAVSVMCDGDDIYMSARLIHVVSGKVEKTVSLDRKGYSNKVLKNLSNNVAYRLLSN